MKLKIADVLAACQGRWLGILSSHGIDSACLRNVHGPCPVCGGTDRFRWDNKDGRGTFFCSGACGHGDGLDLLIAFTRRPRDELLQELAESAGMHKVDEKPKPRRDPAVRIKQILSESKALSTFTGGVVRAYLTGRKLPASKLLMEHPGLGYYEDGKLLAMYPAMVSPIMLGQKVVSLHITYLTQDGKKAPVRSVKKILPPIDSMDGGAIQLCAPAEVMGIAEGIETALAVMRLHLIPCWAAANAGLLAKFRPPEGVKQLIIFGDNDNSYAGQAAAYTLAHKLAVSGHDVRVAIPEKVNDYADVCAEGWACER